MKASGRILLVFVFVFGIMAAAYAIHEVTPSETVLPLPPANAVKLNEYLVKSPYTSWQLWPGKGKLYKGTEPHGSLLTTYINDVAAKSIKGKKGLADGSIIAKENYTADKKLSALTVMYKIKGFNPEAGDWFWAKYSPDGKVEASGKVKGCIDCHGKKMENDYVYTGPVGSATKKMGY